MNQIQREPYFQILPGGYILEATEYEVSVHIEEAGHDIVVRTEEQLNTFKRLNGGMLPQYITRELYEELGGVL